MFSKSWEEVSILVLMEVKRESGKLRAAVEAAQFQSLF